MSVLVWLLTALLGLAPLGMAGTAGHIQQDPGNGVPPEFAERTSLPACGLLGDVRSPPSRAARCLADGLGTTGAELVSTEVDDAGSTWTYYRALPDGRLEIWTQVIARGESGGEWGHRTCEPASDLADPSVLTRQPCAS